MKYLKAYSGAHDLRNMIKIQHHVFLRPPCDQLMKIYSTHILGSLSLIEQRIIIRLLLNLLRMQHLTLWILGSKKKCLTTEAYRRENYKEHFCPFLIHISCLFLAGPKGQLFTSDFPSPTNLLTYSLRQKSSNHNDAIVVACEQSTVGIKVRKQGPAKIEF